MKWKLLFLLLLPPACVTHGQGVRIRNISALQPDSSVLFCGKRNTLTVAAHGMQPNTLQVTVSDAAGREIRTARQTTRDSLVILDVYPAARGPVFMTVNQGGKLLRRSQFRVDTLSFPVARLGNVRDSAVIRAVIQSQNGLLVIDPAEKMRYSGYYRVVSYRFVAEDGNARFEESVNGPFLTNQIRDIVGSLCHGSRIGFSDIRVTCADCATLRLADLRFTILRP